MILEDGEQAGVHTRRGQTKLRGILLDELPQLQLEVLHPIHREQMLETGVARRVRDVRKRVVCQEFIRLRELATFRVKELFELTLGIGELLIA